MTSRPLIAAVLVACAGCSGGPDDPGSGTGTLAVGAEGVIAADFTDVDLEVRARGVPVVDAVITLRDVEGGETTEARSLADGVYRARLSGAARVLRLDVQAGEDALSAGIGGPRAFTITRPPEGALVRVGDAGRLLVEWARPDEEPIDEVTLELFGEDNLPEATERLDGDPGRGRVALPAAPGRFRAVVTRTDIVPLAGGVEGSEIRLSRSARVGFELRP